MVIYIRLRYMTRWMPSLLKINMNIYSFTRNHHIVTLYKSYYNALLCIICIILCSCDNDRCVEKNTSKILSSCVTISNSKGHGSGFIIKRTNLQTPWVVTCLHVVAAPQSRIHDINGNEIPVDFIAIHKTRDLCFLHVKDNLDLPSLDVIECFDNVKLNSDVICFGDSEGEGVIVYCKGKYLGLGKDTIETDAPFVPGNSGGPILESRNGKVLAVATYITTLQHNHINLGTRFDDNQKKHGKTFCCQIR